MLTEFYTNIESFWKSQTIPHIKKVLFQPAFLKELPIHTMIINMDYVDFESIGMTLNDGIDFYTMMEILVPIGKTAETIDAILNIIKTNNNLNRTVLKTTVSKIDLSNPQGEIEGSVLLINYKTR